MIFLPRSNRAQTELDTATVFGTRSVKLDEIPGRRNMVLQPSHQFISNNQGQEDCSKRGIKSPNIISLDVRGGNKHLEVSTRKCSSPKFSRKYPTISAPFKPRVSDCLHGDRWAVKAAIWNPTISPVA